MSDHPPHVLMVCTDHWPGSLFGCRGAPVLTPTCDQLMRGGVVFPNATSECPVCIPARRSQMTGLTPRSHGDRVYSDRMLMPDVPTLAGCFRQAGYQCYASGKLHVYPQRDRIGFDDVALCEEGRMQFGCIDDYDSFLAAHGHAGEAFAHGMGNNQHHARPWHLDEALHPTTWITREACRMISRRDPTRPGFWYVSYVGPHPPSVPPQAYWDMYRDVDMPAPPIGDWARDMAALPDDLRARRLAEAGEPDALDPHAPAALWARRAFLASCTHIDHQLRLVLGALREQGLLDNTIILFTADHGDMLGAHGLWAKRVFYQGSCGIPFFLAGRPVTERLGGGRSDERLVCLADVMPTLLDLAGVAIPEHVEGLSAVGPVERELCFGEIDDEQQGQCISRMIRDRRYKFIYYPRGDHRQLFDLQEDPLECHNLIAVETLGPVRERLESALMAELHDGDEAWVRDGRLVGLSGHDCAPLPDPGLSGQRGYQFPPCPPRR